MTLPSAAERLRFDLISEPWLPITLTDGTTTELGLGDFFARAHEARGLNEPSPLTYTAVMRYLLAILHRAIDGPDDPEDWAQHWRAGAFDKDKMDAYLQRWRHRFDLFDPEVPFAQSGPEITLTDVSPITRLFMERATGNNPTLFDHAWDDNPPTLSAAEVARALLTAQAYGFSGGGGKFYNSTMIAGYSIMLEGHSLFQTLMLNLQEYSDDQPSGLTKRRDSPWWELDPRDDPPVQHGGNVPLGLTDLLTWRSRHLRLIPEPDGSIRRCSYSQRYQLRESGIRDPFKRYEPAQSGDNKGKLFAKNFVAGRALWRDSYALMEQQLRDDTTGTVYAPRPGIIEWLSQAMKRLAETEQIIPTIVATGLVNNQAKIDLWRMERLPLQIKLLDDRGRRLRVRDAVARAHDVRMALMSAGSEFVRQGIGVGDRQPHKDEVARVRASLRLDERYWSRLDAPFQGFLIDLATDPDSAANEWIAELRRIARGLHRGDECCQPRWTLVPCPVPRFMDA